MGKGERGKGKGERASHGNVHLGGELTSVSVVVLAPELTTRLNPATILRCNAESVR